MHNILFVEDDKDIQEVNKNMLERRGGYVVRTAMNLAEARQRIKESVPDLIVLDIMLPDGSGLDFLRELRGDSLSLSGSASLSGSGDIPVLLLTALNESSDVVTGLRAGGDDYLAKPYDNDVLLARIESLLRRTGRVLKTLAKGPLTADIIAGRVFINGHDNGRDLLLTQKEFAVLLLFMQNEGITMSAESVYEKVWKRPLGDDKNTLQVTISNLRKKIDPSGYGISVLRGQGYMFQRF
jgi:DNA-binding response OmpR family regulator